METETIETRRSIFIPVLRFKEFEGKWKNKKLGKVAKYTKGFAFKSSDYRNNGIRVIRVSDLGKDNIKENVEKVYLDETRRKSFRTYELAPGNIIITTVGSKPELIESAVGRAIFVENRNEALLNQNMLKFENIDAANNKFLLGHFYSKRYLHYIKSIARGNANQANITVKDLLNYQIAVPSLPEQQKIASFLSAVDKKIQQLTRKKYLLESYKKGMMQKLFSQEIRFKVEDGKDFPEWEEKKLGNICEMTSSKRVYLADYVDNGIPFFRGKEISVLGLNQIPDDILYISEERYLEYKEKYGVPLKNDILITAVGTLGNVLLIKNDIPFYFKDGNLIWFKNITAIPEFLEYLLDWNKRTILNSAIGSSQKALTMVELRKLKFVFPSKEEQQKIADFLSAIDKKIEAVYQQIEKTQTFKKGLLQQMFV